MGGGGGGEWGEKFHTGLHSDLLVPVCYVVDWPTTYMFI